MATSSKSTHGALAALVATAVMVAFLAGTCTADDTLVPEVPLPSPLPAPLPPIKLTLPVITIVNVTFTNLLKDTITITFSQDILGVKTSSSASISPGASRDLPVSVGGVVAVNNTATITVDEDVYDIPNNAVQRALAEAGQTKVEVSSPCAADSPGDMPPPGLNIKVTDIVSGPIVSGPSCTGPPRSS
ncbi:hypothetical protein M758_7G091400 [Ceratodon purpureus]|nr:hypothetical protein M758_7G091400 [Ceratodon purpureus]